MHQEGEEVHPETIDRVGAILERWKEDHPWITGYDDYPMAALHATRRLPVEEVGRTVEQIYQELRGARFSRGNQLQLATHLLAAGGGHPVEAAGAFRSTFATLKKAGMRVGTAQYDETALLVLSGLDPATSAHEAVAIVDELREHKPRPAKSVAFSLAVGLLLWEAAGRSGPADAGEAATLRAVQAVIEAQQAAAMVAVIAAASVATSAAT
jgi:hypothetical protein